MSGLSGEDKLYRSDIANGWLAGNERIKDKGNKLIDSCIFTEVQFKNFIYEMWEFYMNTDMEIDSNILGKYLDDIYFIYSWLKKNTYSHNSSLSDVSTKLRAFIDFLKRDGLNYECVLPEDLSNILNKIKYIDALITDLEIKKLVEELRIFTNAEFYNFIFCLQELGQGEIDLATVRKYLDDLEYITEWCNNIGYKNSCPSLHEIKEKLLNFLDLLFRDDNATCILPNDIQENLNKIKYIEAQIIYFKDKIDLLVKKHVFTSKQFKIFIYSQIDLAAAEKYLDDIYFIYHWCEQHTRKYKIGTNLDTLELQLNTFIYSLSKNGLSIDSTIPYDIQESLDDIQYIEEWKMDNVYIVDRAKELITDVEFMYYLYQECLNGEICTTKVNIYLDKKQKECALQRERERQNRIVDAVQNCDISNIYKEFGNLQQLTENDHLVFSEYILGLSTQSREVIIDNISDIYSYYNNLKNTRKWFEDECASLDRPNLVTINIADGSLLF
jgi:hypothetical protein